MTTVLRAAYNLLGDGGGNEWGDNPEYSRAILELTADLIGFDRDGGARDLELMDLIRSAA